MEDRILYYILKNTLSLKFLSSGLDLEPLYSYLQEYDVILKNLCLSQWYCEILNDFKYLDKKTHSLGTRTRTSVYKETMKKSSWNEM